jgi:hypothetical protein
MLLFSPATHAEFYKTCLPQLTGRASANCQLPIGKEVESCVLSVCISAFSQPTVYTGYSGDANTIGGDLHRKGDSLLHVDHITSQFN